MFEKILVACDGSEGPARGAAGEDIFSSAGRPVWSHAPSSKTPVKQRGAKALYAAGLDVPRFTE